MSRTQLFPSNDTSRSLVLTACTLIAISSGNVLGDKTYLYYSDSTSAFLSFSEQRAEFIVDPKAKDWVKFQELAKQWRLERGVMSSITAMSTLPSYQKIIGMGERAIPLILAELRAEGDDPDQWFWALRALSDSNPVMQGDQGNFLKMARAWLSWGEREGYAW